MTTEKEALASGRSTATWRSRVGASGHRPHSATIWIELSDADGQIAPVVAIRRLVQAVLKICRQPGFPGLLGTNFVLGLAYSFVIPFMSLWGTVEVGMRPKVFGVFMTVTSLSAIVLSLALARWSDANVSRRTVMLLGGCGGALGYFGYAFVRDVIALTFIGSLALGVAAVCFSQLFAHAREEFNRPENAAVDAPFLMSLLRVFFSLAWTGGPALGALVMAHASYRGVFCSAAGLFLVFLAGILVFVPHRPHPPSARSTARQPLWRVMARPDILCYFSGFVLVFAAHSMTMMNLPLMVTHEIGGTERDVGIIFGIAPVVEVPLMLWFGKIAARGRYVALIRLGVAANVLYFSSLMFAQAPWHIYPMQLISAVSIAITTNITITFFQDLLPGQTGVATSIYTNSFSCGSLLGYLGFGLLLEAIGHRGVFAVCAALSATTLMMFLLFRRPHRGGLPNAGEPPAAPEIA